MMSRNPTGTFDSEHYDEQEPYRDLWQWTVLAVTLPGPVTVNSMMSSNPTGTCDSEHYDEQ